MASHIEEVKSHVLLRRPNDAIARRVAVASVPSLQAASRKRCQRMRPACTPGTCTRSIAPAILKPAIGYRERCRSRTKGRTWRSMTECFRKSINAGAGANGSESRRAHPIAGRALLLRFPASQPAALVKPLGAGEEWQLINGASHEAVPGPVEVGESPRGTPHRSDC